MSFGGVKVVNKMLGEDAQGKIHYIVFDSPLGMDFYCSKALRTAMYKRCINISYYIILIISVAWHQQNSDRYRDACKTVLKCAHKLFVPSPG